MVFAVLLSGMVLVPAHAKEPATAAELLLMPPYCKVKAGKGTAAENSHWKRTFRQDNWVSMHHYCGTILEDQRASKIFEKKYRNRGLRGAQDGYRSHLKETTQDHILRYEIYYRLGKVSRKLNDPGGAMQAFYASMQLKPKYIGNYTGLSDVYQDLGKYQEALDVINQGLAYKPKSRGLLRRKKELEKQLQKAVKQPEGTQQD